ncbi:MAG: response regulator transcription factor [Phocaeicola sp.]
MDSTTTTVIIADNQDITRAGMHHYLSKLLVHPYVGNIEDVSTKKELIEQVMLHPKAIVVLDYTLFDLHGVEELLILEKRFPDLQWLLFSNELSEQFIRRLSLEKSISMVLKENSAQEIGSALSCLLKGDRFLCHQVSNLLITGSEKQEIHAVLTATEVEVLKQIAQGKSVKEIAGQRFSSIHTITTHKKNIFRKLGVNNVYEATKYALRAGVVEMVEYYI